MDRVRVGAREPVLVLPRGGDKLLQLKAGDVVRARVAKVLSGGELSLRIGGTLVQARSPMPLPLGAGILLRVLGLEGGGDESVLKLQFLQVAEGSESGPPGGSRATTPGSIPLPNPSESPGAETLRNLVRDLAARAPSGGGRPEDLTATVRQLLKSLPDDPASLPRDLRHQLLALLQSTLRAAEQSIQKRAQLLLGDPTVQDAQGLPDPSADTPELPGPPQARLPLFTEIEKILQAPLKSLLQDTGVGLEAKLKALAQVISSDEQPAPEAHGAAAPQGRAHGEPGSLGSDLKARLLQLRQSFLEQEASDRGSEEGARASAARAAGGGVDELLPLVDGLLRDIETFQLLSRVTSSFCTFLPLLWKGLREGDIAFKRGRAGGAGPVHYCVVNLDLERLGRVVVVAMMQGEEFFLSFKAEHPELRGVLDAHAAELEEMFRSEGLSLRGVSVLSMDDALLEPFMNLESFESILDLKV